jgi:signal peptidase I
MAAANSTNQLPNIAHRADVAIGTGLAVRNARAISGRGRPHATQLIRSLGRTLVRGHLFPMSINAVTIMATRYMERRTRRPESSFSSLGTGLVTFTERILCARKRRRARLREKAKKRGPVLDWIAAFGSAMIWVLVINQYVLQAYAIPSPSMEPTLLVNDRLFVDKLSFGPELVPGFGKLPALRTPHRGEIVVFESPEYVSRDALFETIDRVVFMATFSMVNLDKDVNGEDRVQFLIKRNVGLPGDIVSFDPLTGEFRIRPRGESRFYSPDDLISVDYTIQRLVDPQRGEAIRDFAEYQALVDLLGTREGIPPPGDRISSREAYGQVFEYWYLRRRILVDPSSEAVSQRFARLEQGIYVPQDRFLPLGDNRDDSHDGRYFGPVKQRALLGRPLFRFWPPRRVGAAR